MMSAIILTAIKHSAIMLSVYKDYIFLLSLFWLSFCNVNIMSAVILGTNRFNIIILSVVKLSVVMLSAIWLSKY
jgi:hypothetical protein